MTCGKGLMVVVAGVALTLACGAAAAAEDASRGVAALGWELVRASGDGDAIVSPVSVWEALAMTHAGARGTTAAEIATLLGMPDDREAIAAASEALRRACAEAKGEKIKLDVANRLWVQRGKTLEEPFTTALEKRFAAAAGIVDFQGAAEAARGEINRWVGDKTARKIDELLKPGSVGPLTRLVLTNAVYMKAGWAEPFEKRATRPQSFNLAGGTKVETPFMHDSGKLVAGKVGTGPVAATVCEIPYTGNRLAMVLVVPDAVDGLPQVLAGLDGDWRKNWQGVRRREVILALPKWTARKPLSLNAALGGLGMKQAFAAGAADFSGMDGTRELFVSAVVHEGFVEVNEEGTEAAAATGVVVGVTSAAPDPEPPLEVKADRPFAWAVVDRRTGTILFAGTVTDPR